MILQVVIIKATPNAGDTKGVDQNSTQITVKETKLRKQESGTNIEKPVIEVSKTPEEGVIDISQFIPVY